MENKDKQRKNGVLKIFARKKWWDKQCKIYFEMLVFLAQTLPRLPDRRSLRIWGSVNTER